MSNAETPINPDQTSLDQTPKVIPVTVAPTPTTSPNEEYRLKLLRKYLDYYDFNYEQPAIPIVKDLMDYVRSRCDLILKEPPPIDTPLVNDLSHQWAMNAELTRNLILKCFPKEAKDFNHLEFEAPPWRTRVKDGHYTTYTSTTDLEPHSLEYNVVNFSILGTSDIIKIPIPYLKINLRIKYLVEVYQSVAFLKSLSVRDIVALTKDGNTYPTTTQGTIFFAE